MRTAATLLVLATSMAAATAVAHAQSGAFVEQVIAGQGGPSGTAQTAPDVGGAAGYEQLVDAVSGFVTIRGAGSGQVLSSMTADAFWTAAGVTGTPAAFSQHVTFNAQLQRWFMSAEEAVAGGGPNRVYLAVSASYDALGPWKAITLPPQAAAVTNTQLAVDPCGAYVTGDTGSGGVVFALPAADLVWAIGGAPSAAHASVLPTIAGVVPAVNTGMLGSVAPWFVARDPATGTTHVDLYALQWQTSTCTLAQPATLAAAAVVDLGVDEVPPSRPAVQPAPAPGLAAGTGAIASAVSDGYSVYGIMPAMANGQLGAAFFSISIDLPGVGPPQLRQVETISDPTADLLAPALALDPNNGIGFVMVRTSATDPPGIYVTAQPSTSGAIQPLVPALAGTAPYSCAPAGGVSAFGRYSSISFTSSGFFAVAQVGKRSADCAFDTAWVNFIVQQQLYPDDLFFGGDDPPQPQDDGLPFGHGGFGCGCASTGGPGGAASSVLCLAVVAFGLRRLRKRGRRPGSAC